MFIIYNRHDMEIYIYTHTHTHIYIYLTHTKDYFSAIKKRMKSCHI